MNVLRTPDERFDNLPGFPWTPSYAETSDGLRMAYLDEGTGPTVLLLHGEPSWSYLYRKMIPVLTGAGFGVTATESVVVAWPLTVPALVNPFATVSATSNGETNWTFTPNNVTCRVGVACQTRIRVTPLSRRGPGCAARSRCLKPARRLAMPKRRQES